MRDYTAVQPWERRCEGCNGIFPRESLEYMSAQHEDLLVCDGCADTIAEAMDYGTAADEQRRMG